jgi:hypothetical protein
MGLSKKIQRRRRGLKSNLLITKNILKIILEAHSGIFLLVR